MVFCLFVCCNSLPIVFFYRSDTKKKKTGRVGGGKKKKGNAIKKFVSNHKKDFFLNDPWLQNTQTLVFEILQLGCG
jgi:hypothetical protein